MVVVAQDPDIGVVHRAGHPYPVGEVVEHVGLCLLYTSGILTHCNAGALAASRYGTALGPILLGQERGKKLRVFADETLSLIHI